MTLCQKKEAWIMHKLIWIVGGMVASLLVLLLAQAGASAGERPETIRQLKEAGEILSLEKIAERANAIKPGEILETELERKRNGYIYEVEILDSGGRVWELKLDAKSGKMIKMEQED
jgi:uncharacterized membrane protein YkoI